jgi:hypothetical protein
VKVLKMMVGNNLKDNQLQQIVDKTILTLDKDADGRIDYKYVNFMPCRRGDQWFNPHMANCPSAPIMPTAKTHTSPIRRTESSPNTVDNVINSRKIIHQLMDSA